MLNKKLHLNKKLLIAIFTMLLAYVLIFKFPLTRKPCRSVRLNLTVVDLPAFTCNYLDTTKISLGSAVMWKYFAIDQYNLKNNICGKYPTSYPKLICRKLLPS